MVWIPSPPPEWVVARPCEGGHQLQAATPPPGWGINAGTPAGALPSGQWAQDGHFLQGGCCMDQVGLPMVDGHLSASNSHSLSASNSHSQHMKHMKKLGRIIKITNMVISKPNFYTYIKQNNISQSQHQLN